MSAERRAGSGRKSLPEDVPAAKTRRIRRLLLAVYLLALLASHVVRWFQPDLEPGPRQRTVMLPEVDGDRVTGDFVGLSFIDSAPDSSNLPVVFLLHGSPVASSFMMALHEELAAVPTLRTITPDLPGFEGSSIDIADYSTRAHARYLGPLMDSLGVDRAHFVGYSMSGGVVLHAARLMPERVESIVMLSAIGVQELELTGDYLLNHSVHALQLAGLWLIREGVPHFGWMDDAILGVPYARNFYDTDQRPLRDILRAYRGPMMIIHGTDDFLVPVEAALEHHRIVPQSRLELIDGGGHSMVITAPGVMAGLISDFVREVELGLEPVRSEAEPARVAAAAPPFDASSLPRASGGQLIVLMILIAGATLVSEDLASIGAGLLAARGTLGLEHAMIASFAGILIGDVGLYVAGRLLGRRIVLMPPFSWMIDERKLARAAAWFREKGGRVIVASRFIPGTRFPTYVAAGTLKAPFRTFLLYFVGASLLWVPIIVGGGMIVGNELLDYYAVYEAYAVWVMIGAIVVIYTVVHTLIPLSTHLGRRRLLSRWRRIRHWEFWPPWAFYPPVAVYILWLALRHRSLSVFTAANPGIETGGFLGESKLQILEQVARATDDVARFRGIPAAAPGAAASAGVLPEATASDEALPEAADRADAAADRTAQVLEWMRATGLSWPVVLKPDVGERGDAVLIATGETAVREHLHAHPESFIAQEFVPGPELGVFWIHRPGSDRGEMFSVTEKHLVDVTGNGTDTLERLIWDDDRAMRSAPLFLRRHADRLDDVPGEGESVRLVDVGTHCRGAFFRDGRRFIRPDLERTFDEIGLRIEGFHFGRFDIRIMDEAAFPARGSFRILELNGVSSEATHIYDPQHSLGEAYRTLFRQWRLAFEIGAANAARGVDPTPLGQLIRLGWRRKIRPERRPDHAASARVPTSVS